MKSLGLIACSIVVWAGSATCAFAQASAGGAATWGTFVESPALVISTVAAIVAAVGGVVGLYSLKRSIETRQEDTRLAQAKLATDRLDALEKDDRATAAVLMLDWGYTRKFSIQNDAPSCDARSTQPVLIDAQAMFAAIGPRDHNEAAVNQFVRDSFDALFTHLMRLAQLLRAGAILVSDIRFPLAYIFWRMAQRGYTHTLFTYYLNYHRYSDVIELAGKVTERPGLFQMDPVPPVVPSNDIRRDFALSENARRSLALVTLTDRLLDRAAKDVHPWRVEQSKQHIVGALVLLEGIDKSAHAHVCAKWKAFQSAAHRSPAASMVEETKL